VAGSTGIKVLWCHKADYPTGAHIGPLESLEAQHLEVLRCMSHFSPFPQPKLLTVVRRSSNLTIHLGKRCVVGSGGSGGMAKAGDRLNRWEGREWRRREELYDKRIRLVSSSTGLLASMG